MAVVAPVRLCTNTPALWRYHVRNAHGELSRISHKPDTNDAALRCDSGRKDHGRVTVCGGPALDRGIEKRRDMRQISQGAASPCLPRLSTFADLGQTAVAHWSEVHWLERLACIPVDIDVASLRRWTWKIWRARVAVGRSGRVKRMDLKLKFIELELPSKIVIHDRPGFSHSIHSTEKKQRSFNHSVAVERAYAP
jgi:hypothetical protein